MLVTGEWPPWNLRRCGRSVRPCWWYYSEDVDEFLPDFWTDRLWDKE